MSIYLPETNFAQRGSLGNSCGLTIPAAATAKAANATLVLGMFHRMPKNGWNRVGPDASVDSSRQLLTRGAGTVTSGSNVTVMEYATGIDPHGFRFMIRNGSGSAVVDALAGSQALISALAGKDVWLGIAINAARVHVMLAPTDGTTPWFITIANTAGYALALTGGLLERIGCGTGAVHSYFGGVEELCVWDAAFPEDGSGNALVSLATAIATGAQPLDTAHTQMTGAGPGGVGVKRCRYRMRDAFDLTDAWGGAGPLVKYGEDVALMRRLRTGGTLTVGALLPTRYPHAVSQVVFGTQEVAATAFAPFVVVESGAYVGITPARIEARLLNEENAVVMPWMTVDAAPAAGAWKWGSIPQVPMTEGWMALEIRAVTGAGAIIGESVFSSGHRGAGFHWTLESQSQPGYMVNTGNSKPLNAGSMLMIAHAVAAADPGNIYREIVCAGDFMDATVTATTRKRGPRRGGRQMTDEMAAIYPRVPTQFSWVGLNGRPITDFIAGGAWAWRWDRLSEAYGGHFPPYVLLLGGHLAGTDSNTFQSYYDAMTAVEAKSVAALGPSLKIVIAQTNRYLMVGTGTTFPGLQAIRTAQRQWAADRPERAVFTGSMSTIKSTSEGPSTLDPHPSDDDLGQGRMGSIIAYNIMGAVGAVKERAQTLKTARVQSGKVRVSLGSVNPPFSAGVPGPVVFATAAALENHVMSVAGRKLPNPPSKHFTPERQDSLAGTGMSFSGGVISVNSDAAGYIKDWKFGYKVMLKGTTPAFLGLNNNEFHAYYKSSALAPEMLGLVSPNTGYYCPEISNNSFFNPFGWLGQSYGINIIYKPAEGSPLHIYRNLFRGMAGDAMQVPLDTIEENWIDYQGTTPGGMPPVWDASVDYIKNDPVQFNGWLYLAKIASKGSQPSGGDATDTTQWAARNPHADAIFMRSSIIGGGNVHNNYVDMRGDGSSPLRGVTNFNRFGGVLAAYESGLIDIRGNSYRRNGNASSPFGYDQPSDPPMLLIDENWLDPNAGGSYLSAQAVAIGQARQKWGVNRMPVDNSVIPRPSNASAP